MRASMFQPDNASEGSPLLRQDLMELQEYLTKSRMRLRIESPEM